MPTQNSNTDMAAVTEETAHLSRRKFLGYIGGASALLATAATAASCKKNHDDTGVDFGSGDTGILNYAYAHAAWIREMLAMNSFADNTVIDTNGLDKSRTPSEVLAIAGAYIKTKVNINNLPTS
ncbi:MAG: hypothetical protein HY305_03170 [Sphingobacteriales bacterium]|nr:hypothetical protein [Sphingobacteriales bacterium]